MQIYSVGRRGAGPTIVLMGVQNSAQAGVLAALYIECYPPALDCPREAYRPWPNAALQFHVLECRELI